MTHRALTATDVLDRYKDLPAFLGLRLSDVNQVGRFGERPLDIAAVRGDLAEIAALLEAGADVNGIGELGNTPLHEAVSQGHLAAVTLLIERGASRAAKNKFGDTALDIAKKNGRDEILRALESGQ